LQNIFKTDSSSDLPSTLTEERLGRLRELENNLAYRFNDIRLLDHALTHRSFVHENLALSCQDNERLEFLGDAVLQLCISDILMKKYPSHMEGVLSKLRASVVNEKPLAELASRYHIGEALLLGRGEENSGGRKKPSLLSNAFEAVIAAIYLDGGFYKTYAFIEMHFANLFEEKGISKGYTDYKTALQEFSQEYYKEIPKYSLLSEDGPDHDKTFEMQLSLAGMMTTSGRGKTKKMAEQDAARKALEQLQDMVKEKERAHEGLTADPKE
jgi:ribonuclease III